MSTLRKPLLFRAVVHRQHGELEDRLLAGPDREGADVSAMLGVTEHSLPLVSVLASEEYPGVTGS